MRDYHILPKLRDSLSYIYIEHAIVQRYRQSVEVVDQEGRAALPIATLSLLMLGPGTRITHEAIKLLADNGCSILWVGENGTKFYAQGLGETRKAHRLLHQARLVCDPDMHREVAIAMYKFRFNEDLKPDLTIEQLRGHEGVRVRNFYQSMGRRYGVRWRGRRYDRNQWDNSDPINRALSSANALMNGICHAAIVSGGYSPGLGFIHTGKLLSFVYDIADLYKTEISIPIAFEIVALGEREIEPRVRQRMRQALKESKLLHRILPDIDKLLNLGDPPPPDESDYDADGALPSPLWDELIDSLDLEEDE
jgi:CRISPR-associated protein Cas1